MISHRFHGAASAGASTLCSTPRSRAPVRSQHRPLTGALWLAVSVAPLLAAEARPSHPSTQTWPVQICGDATGPGSLRYIASHAQSGDTIDLTQLPAVCGVRDSTITLTAGEIVLHQATISLVGPPPEQGSVTLSGGGTSRVLRHQGYAAGDTLKIEDLNVTDGYVRDTNDTGGGCIRSDANVLLHRSTVAGCTAISDTGGAAGGGIMAPSGTITLIFSRISGNTAKSGATGAAHGGGIASFDVQAKYAQISDNQAFGQTFVAGSGGGTWSATIEMAYSTVANNSADNKGGAAYVASGNSDSTIRNSTFSGNQSHYSGGAIFASLRNLHVYNSTIAGNHVEAGLGGGLYVAASSAQIESTIIANNTSAGVAEGVDLYLKNGTLLGTANAIVSSNASLPGFIAVAEDPKLAPLAWIGGPTQAHALLPGSPVTGLGNNIGNWPYEQRGAAFPRTTGPTSTIDIGAVQSDGRIFVSDFDKFFL